MTIYSWTSLSEAADCGQEESVVGAIERCRSGRFARRRVFSTVANSRWTSGSGVTHGDQREFVLGAI